VLKSTVAPSAGKALPADAGLVDYLLHREPGMLDQLGEAPLATLTYLMLNLPRFKRDEQASIQRMFREAGGHSDPFSLATLWAGLVGNEPEDQCRTEFAIAGGWNHIESVSLLYYHRARFSEADQKQIAGHYVRLKSPPLTRYLSVDGMPFTLTDIARALCFQSRNHYFDLFYLIHDYVDTKAACRGCTSTIRALIASSVFGRAINRWSKPPSATAGRVIPRANTGMGK
jgi:hypothetical protein